MTHHNYGPSALASVVLDIGGTVGALIVEAGPSNLGQEIDISPAEGAARTHSMVRERLTVPPRYEAVYPDLQEGRYILWRDETTPADEITINGGAITRYAWTG